MYKFIAIKIMLKEQCISVTDLRTKTKECLKDLGKRPKYIFINNQPVAVLINIDKYEEIFQKTDLIELPNEKVDMRMKKMAIQAAATPKSKLVDI